MRARFYSPDLRRFINQDILLGNIADGQSLNRFAYVTGNPISFIDPFGLTREDVLALIDLIGKRTPDIKIKRFEFDENLASSKLAATNAWGTVLLSKKYEDDICTVGEFLSLLRDLLHEGMHSTDSFLTRQNDGWAQPEMTANHQSIYDRVAWEMGDHVLEPDIPNGKVLDDYIGKRNELSYVSPKLWGINELIRQKGSGRNENSIAKYARALHTTLYPDGCSCND